jgi:hypothetical protein
MIAFVCEISLSYFVEFFNVPQSVRHGGEGFTSPRKEYVLRVCIDP